jgi:hypothetical protein
MEHQRQFDRDRFRRPGDQSPEGDDLNQARREIDDMLEQAERVFDSIGYLDAQDYLQQNMQSGGQ